MHPPEPIPPPAAGGGDDASPARAAAALTRELARYGVTGIYSTAADKVAVISVTATVTVWTNGRLFWCTVDGRRHSWSVGDPGTAAARLASLARPASASLLGAQAGTGPPLMSRCPSLWPRRDGQGDRGSVPGAATGSPASLAAASRRSS
jgi:hypothetical protein